jgi:hypothetical protein
MNITVEQVSKKIGALLKDATNNVGILTQLVESMDDQDFFNMVNGLMGHLSEEIARDMAAETGAPILACAAKAQPIALTHVALFLFASGYQIKADEYSVVDNLTDADIEAGIANILGGSNE